MSSPGSGETAVNVSGLVMMPNALVEGTFSHALLKALDKINLPRENKLAFDRKSVIVQMRSRSPFLQAADSNKVFVSEKRLGELLDYFKLTSEEKSEVVEAIRSISQFVSETEFSALLASIVQSEPEPAVSEPEPPSERVTNKISQFQHLAARKSGSRMGLTIARSLAFVVLVALAGCARYTPTPLGYSIALVLLVVAVLLVAYPARGRTLYWSTPETTAFGLVSVAILLAVLLLVPWHRIALKPIQVQTATKTNQNLPNPTPLPANPIAGQPAKPATPVTSTPQVSVAVAPQTPNSTIAVATPPSVSAAVAAGFPPSQIAYLNDHDRRLTQAEAALIMVTTKVGDHENRIHQLENKSALQTMQTTTRRAVHKPRSALWTKVVRVPLTKRQLELLGR